MARPDSTAALRTSALGPIHRILSQNAIGGAVENAGTPLALMLPVRDRNRREIERIRDYRREQNPPDGNDADALARAFETDAIIDDGTVVGRLTAVLEAMAKRVVLPGLSTGVDVPGLSTGIEFSDSGFREEFRDPHSSSRNQPGHFMTAVAFAFDPSLMSRGVKGSVLRHVLSVPDGMSDREAAMRLAIGHELVRDPRPGEVIWDGPGAIGEELAGYYLQFHACADSDVAAFERALAALGTAWGADLSSGRTELASVIDQIDSNQRGNSEADLLLTLLGWYFGEGMSTGALHFQTRGKLGRWLRSNLMPPRASVHSTG